jgi:hypothetical protein
LAIRPQAEVGQRGHLAASDEGDVMELSVYQMGWQAGWQEAERRGEMKVLARFYERQLQRQLTEADRTALTERVEALGVHRLLDVALELQGEALAAWLGDPAAS